MASGTASGIDGLDGVDGGVADDRFEDFAGLGGRKREFRLALPCLLNGDGEDDEEDDDDDDEATGAIDPRGRQRTCG